MTQDMALRWQPLITHQAESLYQLQSFFPCCPRHSFPQPRVVSLLQGHNKLKAVSYHLRRRHTQTRPLSSPQSWAPPNMCRLREADLQSQKKAQVTLLYTALHPNLDLNHFLGVLVLRGRSLWVRFKGLSILRRLKMTEIQMQRRVAPTLCPCCRLDMQPDRGMSSTIRARW